MDRILFVIPARSGSKGIKNKNIQMCGQHSLLRLSVIQCLNLNIGSDLFVSTDNQDYLDHINDLIDNPPILRPNYLSGDIVGDIEVLIHALHTCENYYKKKYSCVVMIQPTCPLRQDSDILKTIDAILKEKYEVAFTCHEVDKKYHPLKSLKINEFGYIEKYLNGKNEIIARQQLDKTYIRNGAAYSITPKQLCLGKSFFNCKSKMVLTQNYVSIDNLDELKYCENILLNDKNKKNNN